jgi:thiol-disulfide isomerase/thioredoxin
MGILTFNLSCPHCLRENAVLEAFAELQVNNSNKSNIAYSCRSCGGAGIAVVEKYSSGAVSALALAKQNGHVNVMIPGQSGYTLHEVFPKPSIITAPECTPSRAAQAYVEAKENIQRKRFDTAVMLCRKVLDIVTRNLLGDESNDEKLVKRISMLHSKGIITAQMKDWAHIVRIDSNGAVHSDEEFTKDDAEEMLGFTEVFLIYSFTLPAMVEAKKQSKEPQ